MKENQNYSNSFVELWRNLVELWRNWKVSL